MVLPRHVMYLFPPPGAAADIFFFVDVTGQYGSCTGLSRVVSFRSRIDARQRLVIFLLVHNSQPFPNCPPPPDFRFVTRRNALKVRPRGRRPSFKLLSIVLPILQSTQYPSSRFSVLSGSDELRRRALPLCFRPPGMRAGMACPPFC